MSETKKKKGYGGFARVIRTRRETRGVIPCELPNITKPVRVKYDPKKLLSKPDAGTVILFKYSKVRCGVPQDPTYVNCSEKSWRDVLSEHGKPGHVPYGSNGACLDCVKNKLPYFCCPEPELRKRPLTKERIRDLIKINPRLKPIIKELEVHKKPLVCWDLLEKLLEGNVEGLCTRKYGCSRKFNHRGDCKFPGISK